MLALTLLEGASRDKLPRRGKEGERSRAKKRLTLLRGADARKAVRLATNKLMIAVWCGVLWLRK